MDSIHTTGDCIACTARICRFADSEGRGKAHRMFDLSRGERVENASGNSCMKLWTIVSGTAAICTSLPDGRRQISGLQHSGDTLCAPQASIDGPTWLEALEPCVICEQDFSAQMMELQNNPEFLSTMFGVIHKRLADATRHLTTLGRLDSTERVILFLAETARASRRPGPVHLSMSRDEIADYLGLNTETVSRIFGRLRKSGLFTFLSPTEFEVPDFAAVERRLPVPVQAPPGDPIVGPPSANGADKPAKERAT